MKRLRHMLAVAPLLAAPALAQQPQQAAADATDVVDSTVGPAANHAMLPGARIAIDIIPELVTLSETRRPDDAPVAPFQVAGYVEPAPAGVLDAPVWQRSADGGWVYAVDLFSPGAVALRVELAGRLPAEMELRIYDPLGGAAFGPYSWLRPNESGRWWSTIIFGDQIGLEFHSASEPDPATPLPTVTSIAHIYEPPGGTMRGCMHRDASCEAAWASPADSVTMLSIIDSGGNVVGFCSGALLGRQPGDFPPYVMTANHCVGGNGGQATATNTAFVWLFETPSCGGAAPNPNNLPRSDGSLILKRHTGTDWNLLGLFEPPGANYWLGWSTAFWDDGSAATGIHHPGGTFRRISFGTKYDEHNQTFCDSGGQNCFDADVWDIDYTTGFTQPGSSGSPVIDSSIRARGTLSGGPSGDCTISRYGRFDLAYTNLRYYLGNTYVASPVFVNGAVGGDAGNNGAAEQGTVVAPFNTVYEASFAVREGDVLQIVPGSYGERCTIRRAMTLVRTGSSGTVYIGQP